MLSDLLSTAAPYGGAGADAETVWEPPSAFERQVERAADIPCNRPWHTVEFEACRYGLRPTRHDSRPVLPQAPLARPRPRHRRRVGTRPGASSSGAGDGDGPPGPPITCAV